MSAQAFGEPWRPGKGSGVIIADRTALGLAPLADDLEYYGGALVAESIERSRRDRAIACVNACAGLTIPPDAPQGVLAELLDAVEELVRCIDEGRVGPRSQDRTKRIRSTLTHLGRL